MSILISIVVLFIILYLLGVSTNTLMFIGLIILFAAAVIFFLFFLISFVLFIFAKRKTYVYEGIAREENSKYKFSYARYLYENNEIRSFFPTDDMVEKLLYKQKNITAKAIKLFGKTYVFDKCSIIILFLGLTAFFTFSLLLFSILIQYISM